MGRYTDYFKDIWALQANRKVIGMTLFGVVLDNKNAFSPGQQMIVSDETVEAMKILIAKGYDFLFIAGQPPNRTKNLEIQDFENIFYSMKEIITQLGGRIKNVYYAPSTDKNDPYVKPNTGMFERAQNEGMIKWEGSYFIGAEPSDVKAAVKSKATPVLITSGKESKIKAFEMTNQIKVQEFTSLYDFAERI
jgi:histidinol phosphatase-like enzyme